MMPLDTVTAKLRGGAHYPHDTALFYTYTQNGSKTTPCIFPLAPIKGAVSSSTRLHDSTTDLLVPPECRGSIRRLRLSLR